MNNAPRAAAAVIAVAALCLLTIGTSRHVSATFHLAKGEALGHQGRYAAAVQEDRLAVRSDPSAASHNDLGYYLFKEGQYAEAEAECRTAVGLAPQDSHALDSLGQVLSHTGRAKEAVIQCREAVRLLPIPVHLNSLAYALSLSGQGEEARRDWRRVLTMGDPDAAAEARRMLAAPPQE